MLKSKFVSTGKNLLLKTKRTFALTLALLLLVSGFPLQRSEAATKTFDFESGQTGSTTPDGGSGLGKTATQLVSGHTLVITQDQGNLLCMDAETYNAGARTALIGNAVIVDMGYDTTKKLTLTVSGGYTFDLNAFNVVDQSLATQTLKFTTSKGSITRDLTATEQGETINLSAETVLKGVSSVEITDNSDESIYLELDNIVLDNITAPLIALAQVGGVALSSAGVASWNDVANESSYNVQLYKNGSAQGSVVNKSANVTSHDFLSAMRSAGAGNYTVKVTAIGDGTTYSNGAESAASSAQTVAQLSTVSAGLTWTSDVAHWTSVSNAASYDVQLFKDGSTLGSVVNVLAANVASGVNYASDIASGDVGNYTYKVTAKCDPTGLYLDAAQSAASSGNAKLAKVSGLSFSAAGLASWTDVSNEASYDLQLYKDGSTQGSVINKASNSTSHDFLSTIQGAGAGSYTFKVTAKGNGTTSYDGLVSDESNNRTVVQLATVSAGLTWTGNVAHWTNVTNAVSYDVQLYKDGGSTGSPINVTTANSASGADFSSLITANGGGNYTFKVTAKGDNFLILNAVAASAASTGNLVATPLVKVTNVSLSASGVASWDNILNESSFEVQLYKDGSVQGTAVSKAADTLSHNFLSAMRAAGAGSYTVKVTAKGDGTTYSDAPQSDASSARVIAALTAVSAGLTWSSDVAHWTTVANADSYDVQLYKDAVSVGSAVNVLTANAATGADFASAITANGTGNYTYKVTAKADPTSLYLDAAQSVASNGNAKLAKVTNVTLSTSGVASWDNVANEASYDVQLYKGGVAEGSVVNKTADTVSHDFLSVMRAAGAGSYTVKVTAKGDGATSFDGAQSNASTPQSIAQLTAVSAGLTWTGHVAHWTSVSNASSYDVQLYKEGIATGTAINVLSASVATGADFTTLILANSGGNYTFKVTALASNTSLYLDASQSVASANHFVATPLAQVGGVTLDASGVASWTDIANESSYDVQLFKDGNAQGSAINKTANTVTHNFLSAMRTAGAGVYTVKVTAKGDVTNYSDGLQSTASAGQTIAALSTVSAGLTWTGDVAHWTTVANADSYDVQLYKNASVLGSAVNVTAANAATGVDFSSAITTAGGGTYTFKVTAKAATTSLYLDAAASTDSSDNIKAIQLAQVTGASLSATGVASWSNVSNESSYAVQLYKDGNTQGSAVSKTADTLSHDFLAAMRSAGAGVYTVKVTAIGNGTTYSDGLQSTASNSRTIVQLATVTAGTWTGQIANWTGVSNAISYDLQLLKGGVATGSTNNVLASNVGSGFNFGPSILANGIGTYSFNIKAIGDSALVLDAVVSNNSPDNVVSTLDSTPPTVGGTGTITASGLTNNSVTLSWIAGTDDNTPSGDLEYKVVSSTSNNIGTVSDAQTNGTTAQDWSKTLTASITGLTPNTVYYFNVLVRDLSGNTTIYTVLDKQTLQNSHTVTFVSNGGSSVTAQSVLNGQKATRPANPSRSSYSFVNWYSEVGLTNIFDFNTNITAPISLYAKWASVPSNNDDSSSSTTPTPTPPVTVKETTTAVIINGEVFNIGKETSSKAADGTNQTIVSVDKQSILKQINSEASAVTNTVQVNVTTTNADKAVVSLTGDIIKSLEDKNFDLSVKKDGISYTIPAKEFTINTIAGNLNVPSGELQKIDVEVSIKKPTDAVQKVIDAQIKASPDVSMVVPAVDFELKASVTDTSGNVKNVAIDQFNTYVERTIPLPSNADPSKITTGIVFNKDGSFEHIPTLVFSQGKAWYAQLSSKTNSTYSVVYSPLTVDSVKNHWSKAAVEDMASRLVIHSVSSFKPDEAITRGEFTDYIVRGLGLYRKDTNLQNQFKDVSAQSAYMTSISIAKSYGLIEGYGNGSFKPDAKITREEAMVILGKVINFTNLEASSTANLGQFTDAKEVSTWAVKDVEKAVATKIFNGKLNQTIKPKDVFTKAEAAVVIRNLLIEAKLINDSIK